MNQNVILGPIPNETSIEMSAFMNALP